MPTTGTPTMWAKFREPSVRLVCSYLFDWIFCIILLVLFFLLDRLEPFHRPFSVQNTAIMYPFVSRERIPVWALVLIVIVFPVLVIAVIGLGVRRSPYDVHNGILGLLVSVLLTTMVTQVIKVTEAQQQDSSCAILTVNRDAFSIMIR
ncbi:hypothetical protein BG000_011690 [Podila horticola]|nr:hypothetical protein BG000_011690 [Podila horticola]